MNGFEEAHERWEWDVHDFSKSDMQRAWDAAQETLAMEFDRE